MISKYQWAGLSYRFDRRIVLAVLGLGFAVTAFVMVLSPRDLPTLLPEAVFLGGFMSTLYPVCVANAHDRMPADRVVAISGWLILVSGVGSVLGPLISASLMNRRRVLLHGRRRTPAGDCGRPRCFDDASPEAPGSAL